MQNQAQHLERLMIQAKAAVFDVANRTRTTLPELEAAVRDFARLSAETEPLSTPTIGFDKPANVYVVTELYRSGGHRRLLELMFAARPSERHIVVFTGLLRGNLAYSVGRMSAVGAFPLFPDPDLALHDRYLWLRRKLAAYAAQRVILFHHPEDILAAAAAYEIVGRYGRKLYVVRHSDTRPTLGAELADATHIAIRREQAAILTAALPGLICHTLPLSHTAPRATTRFLDAGFFHDYVFTTCTAGGEHKFELTGELAFGEVVAGIIRASRGRHIHLGPVSHDLKESAFAALDKAKLPRNRLTFAGEVPSVAAALADHSVDLFIASFPIGGGMTVSEAASAGVPIAVYMSTSEDDYISGSGHRPPESLLWTSVDELFGFLRNDADSDRLAEMARSSIEWYNQFLSPAKFTNRLAAIFAVTEGRARGRIADFHEQVVSAVFDPVYYTKHYRDIAVAQVDPKRHFMSFGDAEKRNPTILFDTNHYLSQLSPGERKIAEKSPITHYAMRGELRGFSPHPLFDPVLCGLTLRPEERSLFVLGSYIAAERPLRAHTFFDGEHYARRVVPFESRNLPMLVHFLEAGAKLGISPHPLIDMRRLGETPLQAFLSYVTQGAPNIDEPAPDALFDPVYFCGGKPETLSAAAPNLIWAYVILGNRRGGNPHRFVSVEHAARSDYGLPLESRSLLEMIATGTFTADTHPLISGGHIRQQAPWLNGGEQHPTRYFLENAVRHNIDPHPFFSTQYYLHANPDVLREGMNPLLHYLAFGEREGRTPHPFFNGPYYYQTHSRGKTSGDMPLEHYVLSGLFSAVQPHEAGAITLNTCMAKVLFRQGDDDGAVTLLRFAMHPSQAPRHPTLACEVLPAISGQDDGQSVNIAESRQRHITVRRPAVVHATHIAPPSGSYDCDEQYAVLCREVTVIGGNDGIVLQDGRLFDASLAHFDPAIMQVKEISSIVAISPDRGRALIRRHTLGDRLPAGIFACGAYSHNYYHFLLEIVPRVTAADRIAPRGAPILADDRMPAQHFQVLRLLFPHRAIQRISPSHSYKVKDLYIGNMANLINDVAEIDEAPCDAVHYHPENLRQLNGFAQGFRDTTAPRKIYFKRESTIRRMLNAPEIEQALRQRGFKIVQCDQISFAEQVWLAANADVIVAQSGAHLANILFARPGTQVFALYSNTPGTNYYLWDAIGQVLGLQVINVAGWRIAGSTAQGIARVHEDFTLPLVNLLPFLPLESEGGTPPMPENLRGCFDALYAANAEADMLTGAWAIVAAPTPAGFEERLRMLRAHAGAELEAAEDGDVKGLLDHPFFADFGRNIRSGFTAQADFAASENQLIERLCDEFGSFAEAPEDFIGAADDPGERGAKIERLLALVMLYLPAYRMPLLKDIASLTLRLAERYAAWLAAPPFLFREDDDAGYAAYVVRLLDWFEAQFSGNAPATFKAMLYRIVTDLDLGLLLVIDQPLHALNEARNRLLDRFALRQPATRSTPRAADGSEGKRRIGILCRTFEMGPDSEAIVSLFRSFDRTKYEIYAYSIGFRDRVVSADPNFAAEFDGVIQHRRLLGNDPAEMRARILADDLDIFLHANATTYGLRAQELALYHRVAPIQMVLNSHVPMPFGFASFEAYVTGRSDEPETEVAQEQYIERLIRRDGPVICYLNSLKARRESKFDRAAIGLSDDDIVLMNAGSLSKLRHDCLRTMMMPLLKVPKARLLLAPYNPGWAARSQAFAFNRQIEETAREIGVDRSRITVMSELSVAEAESALALCDIYLNPFPHGGATMTHLALINGKPPVTLRRRSTRSIDQFLIQSLGVHDVLADDEAEYVDIACLLALNSKLCKALSDRIVLAMRHPPFVDNPDYSLAIQEIMDKALSNPEWWNNDAGHAESN